MCHRVSNRMWAASFLDMCLDYNSISYIVQRKPSAQRTYGDYFR
jgi:hypothetical protein